MSMYTLLRNNPQPSVKDMESAFEGQLKVIKLKYTITSCFDDNKISSLIDLFILLFNSFHHLFDLIIFHSISSSISCYY